MKMPSSDNTTALAENKVLILYILDQISNGLQEDGLYKIISSINDVNYFYFKEVLTDLLDSKLVGIFTKDEEESVLKITSEGKNALSLTIDVLPGILKLKADNVFQKEFSSIADETSIIAEFIPRSENDYTIKCKVIEKNETLFEVRTFAGSRDRAKKIVDNWNKNASKIYPKMLDILLDSTSSFLGVLFYKFIISIKKGNN